MTFEGGKDFVSLLISALSDEKTRRVGQEGTQAPDDSGEDWSESAKIPYFGMEDLQIWNANGKRQATLPFANEKPSVSQFEIEKPVMQFAIWMMTSFPRLLILLVSACHTPAVAVFMPVPRPATIRPTIICATL